MQSVAYQVAAILVRPAERLCLRLNVRPNVITIFSLGLALSAGIVAARGELIEAGIFYLASGALDLLDGRVARLTGTSSARGAALDSIADRIAEAIVVGGLSWGLAGRLGPLLCFAFASVSMVVSYARARGEALGVSIKGGLMARGPRVVLLALAMLIEGIGTTPVTRAAHPSLLFLFVLALLTLLTAGTALGRIVVVLQALPTARGGSSAAPRPPRIRPVA